jgi:glycosyltransferase involved in cell wall biosynthesis
LLRRALGSFAGASGRLELIVVDDGSAADRAELNQAVCRELPGCRYLRLPASGGASAARNRGFRISQGAHVWFMDDDDYAAPSTVAEVLRALGAGAGEAIVLMACDVVLGATPIERRVPVNEADKLERYRRFGTEVTTSCAVFPRAVLERMNGWDESLRALQDTDLFLRAAEVAQFVYLACEPIRVDVSAPDRITYAFFESQIGKLQFLRKHWHRLPLRRRLRYIGQVLTCTPLLRAAKLRKRLATARAGGAIGKAHRQPAGRPPR